MTVGELVPTKFVWLLDNVELVGTVHIIGADDIGVIPDPNYQHLIKYFRGNQPLPWSPISEPGLMHLETTPLDRGSINRDLFLSGHQTDPAWTLPKKPDGEPFKVINRAGSMRDLQIGDHISVRGRWVIDHHPEFCKTPSNFIPPEPSRCRARGWLLVGQTHTELHPFDWRSIRLVEPLRPGEISRCWVSLAAPLYEQQYLGNWKHVANELAGVSGHVFIDNWFNFNSAVGVTVHVDAPPLPDIPPSAYRRLSWNEAVYRLGRDMRVDDVRTVRVEQRAVEVQVTIIAQNADGETPTIHGPAQNRWIFQAEYDVYWILGGNEISCITRLPAPDGELFGVGGQFANEEQWFLRIEEAVSAVRGGHYFYISDGLGNRINVVAVGSGTRSTLRTNPGSGRPDPLWALPACPNPPIIG